jgi:hypothetical protein
MLTDIYAECDIQALSADCHYVECRYAECHYLKCRGTMVEVLKKINNIHKS